MSVFEEQEPVISKEVNVAEQEKINKELEEFLQQIREIRDGPPKETVEGIMSYNDRSGVWTFHN